MFPTTENGLINRKLIMHFSSMIVFKSFLNYSIIATNNTEKIMIMVNSNEEDYIPAFAPLMFMLVTFTLYLAHEWLKLWPGKKFWYIFSKYSIITNKKAI